MNLVDVVVVLVVLVLGLRGFRRGFLREVFTFAGWLGGFLGAFYLMIALAPPIARSFGLPIEFGGLIAFVGVFLLVSVVCWFTGWALSKLIGATPLAPLDRFAGLTLGLAQGLVLSALLCFVLYGSPLFPSAHEPIEQSLVGQTLVTQADAVLHALRQSSTAEPAEETPDEPAKPDGPRKKGKSRDGAPRG